MSEVMAPRETHERAPLPRWRSWLGGLVLIVVTPLTWVALFVWFALLSVFSNGGIAAWEVLLLLLGACVPVVAGLALLRWHVRPIQVAGGLAVLGLVVGGFFAWRNWPVQEGPVDAAVELQEPTSPSCLATSAERDAAAAVLTSAGLTASDTARAGEDPLGNETCVYDGIGHLGLPDTLDGAQSALTSHGYEIVSPAPDPAVPDALLEARSGDSTLLVEIMVLELESPADVTVRVTVLP